MPEELRTNERRVADLTPGGLVRVIAGGVMLGMSAWLILFVVVANTNWGAENFGLPVKFFVSDDRSPDEAPLAGPGGPTDPIETDDGVNGGIPRNAPPPDSDFGQGYASVEDCLDADRLAESECERLYGDEGISAPVVAAIALAAVALLVGAVLLIRRRRSRSSTAQP